MKLLDKFFCANNIPSLDQTNDKPKHVLLRRALFSQSLDAGPVFEVCQVGA
jgi:hypothetical protein